MEKSWSDNCVLSTGTRKYLKATGNEETGQPPMQSHRAGQQGTGNWPTTCAFKLGKWLGKPWSNNCVQSTSTRKYLMASWKGETGQLLAQSNQADVLGNHGRTTNCVLSTGTRKYLKATVNGETGQSLVQSNRAGTCIKRQLGMGELANHLCSQIGQVAVEIMATRKEETGQPPVQSNRAGSWGNHCRTPAYYVQVHANIYRQLGRGKLANYLCSKIGQVAVEIMVRELTAY
ncbi:unnamed protein product [Prunus armeniaca]